jgi:hypothetical protein
MGGCGCVSAGRTSIRLGAGSGHRPFDSRARFWAIAGTDGALCIVAAVAFALSPLLTPGKRLAILSIGTGLLILLGL